MLMAALPSFPFVFRASKAQKEALAPDDRAGRWRSEIFKKIASNLKQLVLFLSRKLNRQAASRRAKFAQFIVNQFFENKSTGLADNSKPRVKNRLAMQILKFCKTNWFSIGLVLIVLIAFARKNLRVSTKDTAAPAKQELRGKTPQVEKFTDEGSRSADVSRMDILPSNSSAVRLPTVDEATTMAFFKRFGKVVVEERRRYGIPASVALACAYVGSFSGKRDLAAQSNNYFALPCSPGWGGQTATAGGRCYRRYGTAWDSFRDFSIYLSGQDWFAQTKKEAGQNWRLWAQSLDKQGVSDVQDFGQEVEKIIQAYRLFELDARK